MIRRDRLNPGHPLLVTSFVEETSTSHIEGGTISERGLAQHTVTNPDSDALSNPTASIPFMMVLSCGRTLTVVVSNSDARINCRYQVFSSTKSPVALAQG